LPVYQQHGTIAAIPSSSYGPLDDSISCPRHDIATTYGEALRANLEDAANSAVRIATTKNFMLLPDILVSETIGLMVNSCTRMATVSQEAFDTILDNIGPLRSRW
jgi:hypothetical protein